MSRTTPKKKPQLARQADLESVLAARVAVEQAMKDLHARNPAKYHHDRPALWDCPFDSSCPFTAGSTK